MRVLLLYTWCVDVLWGCVVCCADLCVVLCCGLRRVRVLLSCNGRTSKLAIFSIIGAVALSPARSCLGEEAGARY
jgi:hypothetical protein